MLHLKADESGLCVMRGVLERRKVQPQLNLFSVRGDGQNRTAVQTSHQRAFYTLSLPLVFDSGLPVDRLS